MAKAAPKKSTEELYAWDAEKRGSGLLLCGVDEAGRGPLAGDVYAAAVILDPSKPLIAGLNDSKKMTEKKRDALFEEVKSACLAYCVASASVEEIETLNILGATMLAMQRAVAGLSMQPGLVLIDGNRLPQLSVPAETVVKGDATSASIAAASILAKVSETGRFMNWTRCILSMVCKAQGLRDKAHCEAILQYGPCPAHRPVFCESYIRIMKMKTTEIGRLGETEVCRRLEQLGYSIVKRNFCIRGGEIDIIARMRNIWRSWK
ncbi:MAG: ribonuclease HII [Ruminococcus callidus]